MAFNVMDMIQASLTTDNIGTIAGALGLNSETVQKGLGAALPTLLAGVMGAASKPEGQQILDTTLAEADEGMLGNLGSLLSGGASSPLISTGAGLLSGLLGDSKVGVLSGALASSLGASKESSNSLLGLAAPMLMSMLAGAKKSEGLDTGGLLNALVGQKDLIAKAIPGDLGNALQGSGILDDMLGGAAASAVGAAADAAGSAASAVAESAAASVDKAADATAQVAKSSTPWLRWIIIALAILALFYFFAGGSGRDEPNAGMTAPGSGDVTVGGVNVTTALNDFFFGLNKTLGTVSDATSANAAVADLEMLGTQLGTLERTAASLPPSGRSALASAVEASLPAVQSTADSLLGDSMIGPILQPALEDIMARLAALAGG